MILSKITTNISFFSTRFSKINLTQKASLNALASTVDYAARVAVEFVITPLLLAGLGDYLFGVWRILWRLNGYMLAAGGRSAQALKWAIAKQQSSHDLEEKRRYIGRAVIVWLLFLPLLGVLGGAVAWFAPILLELPTADYVEVRAAAAVLVANVILLSLADVPRAVLQGENLGYKRMGASALLVFVGGGLMVLAVILKLGLIGLAIAALLTTSLTGLLFLLIVRQHVPWFGIRKPSAESVRWFFGLSGWFIVWKFVMQFMMAGDVLILGIFDSVDLVTTYSLTKYIPEALIRLVAILVFGIAPGLGAIIGTGNLPKATRVRGELMTVSWLLLTVAGATVLLWNQTFLRLWVGREYDAGILPTLLIILMVSQLTLIRNDSNIIDLTLDVRRKVMMGLGSAFLSLLLAAVLLQTYASGITGLCLGIMAGRLILTLSYPWQVGRFLDISFNSQLKSVLKPLCVSIFLFGMIFAMRDVVHIETWFGLTVASGTTAATVAILALFLGLTNDQRNSLLARTQRVMR